MDNMKKWNYVISGVVALFGAAIILLASKFTVKLGVGDPGAGFWPLILGCILVFLSVIQLIRTITHGKQEENKKVILNAQANKRVYIAMLIILLFCVILYFLGFYIAALFFIPAIMKLMEVKDNKKIVLTAIITVVAVYVLFGVLLKTPLPEPIFIR